MKTLQTSAWCLVGANGKCASLTPIVRFRLNTDGNDQLRKGWDSADPANAPHEWVPIETPMRLQHARIDL